MPIPILPQQHRFPINLWSDGELVVHLQHWYLQAAYTTAQQTLEIPIVYTAVTNPEEAELAGEDKAPGEMLTGTNNLQLPVSAAMKMIREMLRMRSNQYFIHNQRSQFKFTVLKRA